MRVPQVSDRIGDRIKEVPAQALRGVFAGIGQILLITDRLRNKTPAHQQVPQARKPESSETVAETPKAAPAEKAQPAEKAAGAEKAQPAEKAARAEKVSGTAPAERAPETRDFDKTGNVRLLDGPGAGPGNVAKITDVEDPVEAAATAPAEAVAPAAAAAPAEAVAPAEAAAPSPDITAPTAEDLPLPNYDELSIASLRARLRNLDVAQVRRLAEYERTHAARADVIAMFERRIAKLEAGD